MRVGRYKRRFFAAYDGEEQLICVCVYRKGAREVVRRLEAKESTMENIAHLVFVGFGRLEEWIAALDHTRPVFAMPLVEYGSENSGLRIDTLLVVCQQVDPEGKVLYCRLRAAEVTRCYGEPFEPDWREREAAWKSLWSIVEERLLEQGFTLQRATVAAPQTLKLLTGTATFIEYDKAAKRFVRRAA